MGTRFGHYTDLVPKGFVSIGDKPMILRSIEVLLSCGITRIVIGTGYRCEVYEELKKDYPMIETCFSPLYAETNSMYTLYNTREVLGDDDFLLLESDLIFEPKAIRSLLDCAFSDVMLITPVTKFQDQYYVEYDSEHTLTNCSVDKDDVDVKGELVISYPMLSMTRCAGITRSSFPNSPNWVMNTNFFVCHVPYLLFMY